MKLNAYVLGIDPGSESGAGLLNPAGCLLLSAELEAKDARERGSIVAEAVRCAKKEGVDLIIAREKWQAGGPHMTPRVAAGLGAAWGLWREQIYLHAAALPPNRIHSVFPSTWRSEVLGAGAKSSGGWEALARNYVNARYGVKNPGPNEVVGICIASWALIDAKVRKSVQERPRWHALLAEEDNVEMLRLELDAATRRLQELERALATQVLNASTLEGLP